MYTCSVFVYVENTIYMAPEKDVTIHKFQMGKRRNRQVKMLTTTKLVRKLDRK